MCDCCKDHKQDVGGCHPLCECECNTAKHTPGPWTVETVETSVGSCHKIMPLKACLYMDSVRMYEYGPHPSPRAAAGLANALLIAASPELLSELKVLRDWARVSSGRDCWCADTDGGCAMCRTKALIAKATGVK